MAGAVFRRRRDSRGQGHRGQQLPVVTDLQPLEQQADLLEALARVRERGVGQDEHELLSAVATGDVALAQVLAQHPARLAQHQIARIVPERVVESLEVVQVEHREAERGIPAQGAMQLAGEGVLEVAPVEQSRQRIARGLLVQLLPQSQVRQGELDRFAYRHGQLVLTDVRLMALGGRRRDGRRPGSRPAPSGEGKDSRAPADGRSGSQSRLVCGSTTS